MKSVCTWRKAFVMFVCLVLQSIANGVAVSLGVMFAELVDMFEAPRSKAALIQGLFMFCMTSGGILWTGVFRRNGTGLPTIFGSLVASVGLFASAYSPNLEVIAICTGIIGGIGTSVNTFATFVMISWVFHTDAGFPLSLLTVGSSIGQIIMPYLTGVFVSLYAWSGAFLFLAAVTLQCVPCGFLLHFARDMCVYDKSKNTCTIYDVCDIKVLKDVVIWILLITYFIWSMSVFVEIWFLVDQVMSVGFSREDGTILLSTIGFANLIGRVTGSALRYKCNSIPSIIHWLYVCPMVAVGHSLIISYLDSYTVLVAACVIHGLGFGMTNALIGTIVYESTSHDMYPQTMALANFTFGEANLLINLFGGNIRDKFGGYEVIYYLATGGAIVVTIMSAILSYMVHRRRKLAEALLADTTVTMVRYETLK